MGQVRPGRPFNDTTKLGKLMVEAGVSVVDVAAMTGISHRTLSDYLARRRGITRRHVTWLCALFDVEAEEVVEGEG